VNGFWFKCKKDLHLMCFNGWTFNEKRLLSFKRLYHHVETVRFGTLTLRALASCKHLALVINTQTTVRSDCYE
jgi:hypothetical protein